MRRVFKLLLLLGIGLALRRTGDGDGTSNRTGGSDDGPSRPPETSGKFDASQGTESASKQIQAEAEQGRSRQATVEQDVPGPSDRYNSNGDPMQDLGPGRETNPEEWNSLVAEAEALGVEVRYRDGGIFYAPGTSRGQPGQINIDPDASYSALMHEMSHVRDDHNAGWRGFEGVYDRDFLAQSERDAYQVEIDYANEIGRPDLVEELETLRDDRVNEIYGQD